MDELNEAFTNYMEEFKKQPIETKRTLVIDAIKELIAVFDQLAQMENIQINYLQSREINDIKSDNVSEDDFLEAELVYIETAKNIIGEYLNNKM